MKEIKKNAPVDLSIILVGNKNDMVEQRQVSVVEGKELADHYNIEFIETSAK
jgi:uncharacterized protein YejL (UPF0352 family)